MNRGAKYIGLAGLCLLGSLAAASPASAETKESLCKAIGGTWVGDQTSSGTTSSETGACLFGMVLSDSSPAARARVQRACTGVGGRVSQRDGKAFCSVSGASLGRAKASAEFRSATGKR